MEMYLQKVIAINFFVVDVLKVTHENNRIRIRIHYSEVWILGSGHTKISSIRNTA
jgi:hypothetical protein